MDYESTTFRTSSPPPEMEYDNRRLQQENAYIYRNDSDSDNDYDTSRSTDYYPCRRVPDYSFLTDLDAYFEQEELLLSWTLDLLDHQHYMRECAEKSEWKFPEGWDEYDSDIDDIYDIGYEDDEDEISEDNTTKQPNTSTAEDISNPVKDETETDKVEVKLETKEFPPLNNLPSDEPDDDGFQTVSKGSNRKRKAI